ncbi:hypothetical protein KCU88_g333, partial [Aureobasidium melanogenum]
MHFSRRYRPKEIVIVPWRPLGLIRIIWLSGEHPYSPSPALSDAVLLIAEKSGSRRSGPIMRRSSSCYHVLALALRLRVPKILAGNCAFGWFNEP